MGQSKQRTANTGLAKVAVQCSADTFVVNQTLVLRINICGENRHLRQARKRYAQLINDHKQDFTRNTFYFFSIDKFVRTGQFIE